MKTFIYSCIFYFSSIIATGQNMVWQIPVDHKDIQLRLPQSVVLGQLEVDIPSDGKVNVRFNGYCTNSVGDGITLGANNIPDWDVNDGNVSSRVKDSLYKTNTFSHSRTFTVQKGKSTYYAVGQNWVGQNGDGIATIKGQLTVEFVPDSQDNSIFTSDGMTIYPQVLNTELALLDSVSITTSVKGKVMVVFDGAANSDSLISLATNSIAEWPETNENTDLRFFNHSYYTRSFINTRVYSVDPGTHTFYAMGKKIQGNMTSSNNAVYASLNAHFIADNDAEIMIDNISFDEKNMVDDEKITELRMIQIDAPADGKAVVYLTGIGEMDMDDDLILDVFDTDTITNIGDGVFVQPSSQYDHSVPFSRTRIFDVKKGTNTFYAFAKYNNGDNGTGSGNVKGQLIAKFVEEPGVMSSIRNTDVFRNHILLYPNPTTGLLFGKSETESLGLATEITIFDSQGKRLSFTQIHDFNQFSTDLSHFPDGVYYFCVRNSHGIANYKIVKGH